MFCYMIQFSLHIVLENLHYISSFLSLSFIINEYYHSIFSFCNTSINKDENDHRFALSAIRGELLEREREIKREREKERIWEREKEKIERENKRKQR